MEAPPRRLWRRFSLSTLFVLLALLGVALGCLAVCRRAEPMQEQSERHLMQAAMLSTVMNGLEQMPSRSAKQDALLSRFQMKFNYHSELSPKCLKYKEAIWRP